MTDHIPSQVKLLYYLAEGRTEMYDNDAAQLYFYLIFENEEINYKDPTIKLLQKLIKKSLKAKKFLVYNGHGLAINNQKFKRWIWPKNYSINNMAALFGEKCRNVSICHNIFMDKPSMIERIKIWIKSKINTLLRYFL
jgi:hypothetical protein